MSDNLQVVEMFAIFWYFAHLNIDNNIKEKLIRDGIKLHQCEKCGLTEWNGKPIPLELHHKDGDHYNNEMSNLEILCPNCHAQEPNNSGAGIKK